MASALFSNKLICSVLDWLQSPITVGLACYLQNIVLGIAQQDLQLRGELHWYPIHVTSKA